MNAYFEIERLAVIDNKSNVDLRLSNPALTLETLDSENSNLIFKNDMGACDLVLILSVCTATFVSGLPTESLSRSKIGNGPTPTARYIFATSLIAVWAVCTVNLATDKIFEKLDPFSLAISSAFCSVSASSLRTRERTERSFEMA